MANRGDSNSIFPRQLKRMLSLTSSYDSHIDGNVRRLMIAAHSTFKSVREKKLRQKFGTEETSIDS